jgi:hypothetical protein
MHDSVRHRELTPQAHLLHGPSIVNALLSCGFLSLCGFLSATLLTAQTPPAQPTPAAQTIPDPVQPPAHRRLHSATTQPSAAQVTPATPPAPEWPINDRPVPAIVTWNREDLRIDAANSSLQQILTDVATATGSTVEGLTKDERIFGNFGPAAARDVLAQLLQGSGYNIVMVGDQGWGVPRELILSARNTNKAPQGMTHPSADDNEDDSADYPQYDPQPQTPQPPVPVRPGFPPDGSSPMRAPQPMPQQPQTQPVQQPTNPPNQ